MDVEKLNRFITIADVGSITLAADMLYLAQPTLSKYLSTLESELGARLFYRTSGNLQLTPAGKILYDSGKQLIANVKTMYSSIEAVSGMAHPHLSVMLEQFKYEPMYQLLSSMYDMGKIENFKFEVLTISNDLDTVVESVSSGKYDFGILCAEDPFSFSKELSVISLMQDEYGLLVSREHAFADSAAVNISELGNENLICQVHSSAMDGLHQRLCRRSNHNPELVQCCNELNLMPLVKRNLCVTFCYKKLVASGLPASNFAFADLAGIETKFHLVLLWNKSNKNQYISKLINSLDSFFPNFEWIE